MAGHDEALPSLTPYLPRKDQHMSPRQITVLGECVADAFTQPPPAPNELALRVLPGGGPANTAIALARLGTPARFLARLSDDVFGRLFRAHLEASGVDLSHAVIATEPSTLAVAELDATGQAAFSFHAQDTADWQWTRDELADVDLSETTCLHTGSLALVRAPARRSSKSSSRQPHRTPPSASTPTSGRSWWSPGSTETGSPTGVPLPTFCGSARTTWPCCCQTPHPSRHATSGTPTEHGSSSSRSAPTASWPPSTENASRYPRCTHRLLTRSVRATRSPPDCYLDTRGLLGKRLTALGIEEVAEACRFAARVAALTCSVAGPNPPWPQQLAQHATTSDASQQTDAAAQSR